MTDAGAGRCICDGLPRLYSFKMSPQYLQNLATTRLQEAQALFEAGLYDGSVYLCGYVVEMALKACICRTLDLSEYPESESGFRQIFRTHDFKLLLLLSGLRSHVEAQRGNSVRFNENWSLATAWQLEDRYTLGKTRDHAQGMLEALQAEPEGVLTWLSQRW